MVQRCWVNFQCRGVLLIWIIVGQGPTVLAVGAGGGCLDIFSLIYHFSFLSPSLWETARYRLKYCLKGPLSPKQSIDQSFFMCVLLVSRGSISGILLSALHYCWCKFDVAAVKFLLYFIYTAEKNNLYVPETKTAEFANNVDLDEVAHDEPPHLDLHCLPSSL